MLRVLTLNIWNLSGHWRSRREAIVRVVRRWTPDVAGDLNAEPDSSAVRYLSGLASFDGASVYLQDAWRLAGGGGPGITWSNRNPHAALDQEPDRRIDYIFSGFHGRSGGGRPVECRVVGDEPADGVWPSDHFGLLAVLQR